MKFGIKIFGEKETAEYFKDKADFLEVMAIDNVDYDFLKDYPLPIVIHSKHEKFGINIPNPDKKEKNISNLNYLIKLADKLNSKKIIIHPGVLSEEGSSVEEAVAFFKNAKDKRIIIENLPPFSNSLCNTPENTKEFLKKTGEGFCFDINHAISSALHLKKDYWGFIKEFLKLNPTHCHIGGQTLNPEKSHLTFEESDIPLKEILRIMPKDSEITLEVKTSIEDIEKDLNYIRSVEREL